MGWMMCDPTPDGEEHEGWVVGLVRDETAVNGWRQLSCTTGDTGIPVDEHGYRATMHLQVGCECGWRSQRLYAPLGTDWMPCCVVLEERHDDVAYRIWKTEHIERLTIDGRTAIADRAEPWRPSSLAVGS